MRLTAPGLDLMLHEHRKLGRVVGVARVKPRAILVPLPAHSTRTWLPMASLLSEARGTRPMSGIGGAAVAGGPANQVVFDHLQGSITAAL